MTGRKGYTVLTVNIPRSSLGRSTGRCSFEGAELLIAMKCYFDGSEGQDEISSKWLTLAGYCATDAVWARFGDEWQRMLRERYPIAPYIHMWQIVHGKDPFERKAGWTDEKIDSLIIDAVKLLQSLDTKLFRSFVCSVDLSAHDRLVRDGYQVQDPFSLCADMCVGGSMDWFLQKGKPEPIYLFFDRGEKFMSSVKQRWLRERTPLRKISGDPSKLWDSIHEIEELDMERNPPLQAADMVAWARNRSFSEQREWSSLSHIMRQMIPHSTATITEEIMRRENTLSANR
jgi:Protein of unknown function (DUF3800)